MARSMEADDHYCISELSVTLVLYSTDRHWAMAGDEKFEFRKKKKMRHKKMAKKEATKASSEGLVKWTR